MNNNDPFVSVIVASYNYGRYIAQTLESIINQTYGNLEVIVIDDGSTDGSVEVIKAFEKRDARIALLQHDGNANKGLAFSVKKALDRAKGQWIAFCESDDYWSSDHPERKVGCARRFEELEANHRQYFGQQ